jgi:hypothetical protein
MLSRVAQKYVTVFMKRSTKSATTAVDTTGDLMMAWQRSPRLKKLTKSTQTTYDQALRRLSGMLEVPVRKVTRRDMLDQMFA